MIPTAERIDAIAQRLYVSSVSQTFGTAGVHALLHLLAAIRRIYAYLEPDCLPSSLVVFRRIDGIAQTISIENARALSVEALPRSWDAASGSPAAIEVLDDGYMFSPSSSVDLSVLSREAVVYLYAAGSDIIVVNGDQSIVPSISDVHASAFSVPTFRRLRDALERYGVLSIATSRCRFFQRAWLGGDKGNRVLFNAKPENIMQDSLTQYLENVLGGDAEVRPEQNTGRSHPVDVKVTWMLTNRIALIEVKWLGKSVSASGKITTYSQARANSGAKQLASYLERNKQHAPSHITIGYLVIIDGRRRNVKGVTQSISEEDGMYYRYRELKFTPPLHEIRHDFTAPIRMFAEPVL